MSHEMIEDMFNRVVFDEQDRATHQLAYREIKEIAKRMDLVIPDSADKTLTFRALHLALMHFGTALSKQDKYRTQSAAVSG